MSAKILLARSAILYHNLNQVCRSSIPIAHTETLTAAGAGLKRTGAVPILTSL